MINNLDSIDYKVLIRDNQDTHKGTFGTVAIIGGRNGTSGSVILVGRSSLLLGSGKVILSNFTSTIDYLYPELMFKDYEEIIQNLDTYNVVIVGPGLGTDDKAIKIMSEIINVAGTQRFIFDADALNIIASHKNLHKAFIQISNKIITPHPLEAARLLNLDIDEIINEREAAVLNLAKTYNAITLLKGHKSLIANGLDIYQNETGNSVLSVGGQGDALCGMIAAFIANGLDLLNSLRVAVYIHGLSANDIAITHGFNGISVGETTMNARSILNKILYPHL